MDEDLIKYLAWYWQDVNEIIAITDTENVEVDKMENEINYVGLQGFLFHMDEISIRRWERILGILPIGNVEERRNTVISLINNYPPYSYKWWVNKLNQLLGKGYYYFTYDYNNAFFYIYIDYSIKKFDKNIRTFIEKYLPCHVGYEIEYYENMSNQSYIGGVIYVQSDRLYSQYG